jgi:hypothetical protein
MTYDEKTNRWSHHVSCATQQWQPGHLNTQTAVEVRKATKLPIEMVIDPSCPPNKMFLMPTPPERFGQHVTDPANDPERRNLQADRMITLEQLPVPLKTREQLDKEAAARVAELDALLKWQTHPLLELKLPAKEADALPTGKAAKANSMPHPLGGGPTRATILPDGIERKQYPIASGFLDYFPDAVAYLAHLSWVANQQHNPGQPVHWARGKSMDHPDCLMKHFVQRGTIDTDRIRHTGKVAWRALAMLQEELEQAMKEEAA